MSEQSIRPENKENNVTLDFTRLFEDHPEATGQPNLGENGGSSTGHGERQKAHIDAPEALKELLQGITRERTEASKAQREAEQSLTICKEYQRNKTATNELQADILKGLAAGEDIGGLFLKAVKALSILIANPYFFTQAERDYITIYGSGLHQAYPLEIRHKEALERLERLETALVECNDEQTRAALERSVEAHRSRIAALVLDIDNNRQQKK